MEGKKLEDIMLKFMEGEFDVLVSTTIIESGLDVPNANTIFINNANNLVTATSKQTVIYWNTISGKELYSWNITAFSAGTTVLSMKLKSKGKLWYSTTFYI